MIGQPVKRREDERILRGLTSYVDDIDLPGAGHLAFVRSPHARASIKAIRVPSTGEGLIAVLTADDLAAVTEPFPVNAPDGVELADAPHPVLARGEVRYEGQPVVAVIARSRALAEDLAELVGIDYEPCPAVLDARRSTEQLLRLTRRGGDVEGAFAAASSIVRGSYELPRLAPVPLEPRGAIASYSPGEDQLTVWCSVQDQHRPRAQLSHILRRPAERIRVIVPDVGGAFGSKGVIASEVAVAAAAALKLGRPVRWTEDRLENLLGSYQGRGIAADAELALDGEGRMLAIRAHLWADLGAYLLTTTAMPPLTATMLLTGCYRIDAAQVDVIGARTDKVPTGPYRGAGRPEAAYVLERLVDDAARELGIEPATLRRRNLVREFPHRTPLGFEYDSGDYERCLDLALSLRHEQPRRDGAAIGSGVALYVERAGGQWESAEIELRRDGSFEVLTSACAHGQGHATTFAQIAADALGVDPARITVSYGDSATSPAGVGTFGSRSAAVAGSAVNAAAIGLVERCAELVAGERSWERIAQTVAPIRAHARFDSPLLFSSGAHAASVEIDRATGELRVLELVAVDDSGTVINPLLVHGQVLGGAAQALGECLCEQVIHDPDGRNLSRTLMDYSLPTAAEMPPIATAEVTSPTPHNPLGAKGAGEGGAVGALPAIANAVVDALGGRHVDPPFTADKLWRALR
jgi:carbon-monoxide dehydrogenase large subunit